MLTSNVIDISSAKPAPMLKPAENMYIIIIVSSVMTQSSLPFVKSEIILSCALKNSDAIQFR